MDKKSEVKLENIQEVSQNGQEVEQSDKPGVIANIAHKVTFKPDLKVRPQLEEEEAIRLAERLYGISTNKISQLVSFEDQNFLIHVDTNIKNPIIPTAWPHGYVLKIINSLESKEEKYFDAQTQMLLFLRQQGIECPKPVMNVFGKYHSVQKIDRVQHLVRLLEYLPGDLLTDLPIKTHYQFYQVGEWVARIDGALKRFTHDAYNSHKSWWMLDQVPELKKVLCAVEDLEKQALVQQIIAEFQQNVLSQSDKFAKGIIHGDINDYNVIVSKTDISDEPRVSGVIDFGDTSCSPYIFDLAITIASMVRMTDDLETGGYIIAGYEMVRPIPEKEREVLKVCVAARLCQGLVLSAHSLTTDQANEYLSLISKSGWNVLTRLWETPDIEEIWFNIADNYLKQSVK